MKDQLVADKPHHQEMMAETAITEGFPWSYTGARVTVAGCSWVLIAHANTSAHCPLPTAQLGSPGTEIRLASIPSPGLLHG